MAAKLYAMRTVDGDFICIDLDYGYDHVEVGQRYATTCAEVDCLNQLAKDAKVDTEFEVVPFILPVGCEYQVIVERAGHDPIFAPCADVVEVRKVQKHYAEFGYFSRVQRREVGIWEDFEQENTNNGTRSE